MATSQLIVIAAFVVTGAMFLQRAWRYSRGPDTPESRHLVRGSLWTAAVALFYAAISWFFRDDPGIATVAGLILLVGFVIGQRELNNAARAGGREVSVRKQVALFALVFGVPLIVITLLARAG